MIKKTLLALAISSAALTTVTANAYNFYKSDVATVYAKATLKTDSNVFSGSYDSLQFLDKDYKTIKTVNKSTLSTISGPDLVFNPRFDFGASFNLPNELKASVAVRFDGAKINTFSSVGSKTTTSIFGGKKVVEKTKYKLGKLPTKNFLTYKYTDVTLGHPQVGTLSWSDIGKASKVRSVYSFAYSAPKFDLLSGKLALTYAFGYNTNNKVILFGAPTLENRLSGAGIKADALNFNKIFTYNKTIFDKAVEHDLKAKYTFADDSTFTAKLDRVLTYTNNSGIYALDSRYVKYSFDYERDICGFDTTFSYAHVTVGKVDGKGSLDKNAALASNKFSVDTSYTVNDYLAPEFSATYTTYRVVDDKSNAINTLDLELQNTFTAFNYMGVKGTLSLDATYTFSYLRYKDEAIKEKDTLAVVRDYGHDYGLTATFKIVY